MSKATNASAQPVPAFPTLPPFPEAADAAVSPPSTALKQQESQHRGTDNTASVSAQAMEELPVNPQRDAPLLQINPAQLSRSSSRITSSPRLTQQGADTMQNHAADSYSEASSATAAGPLSQAVSIPSGLDAAEMLPDNAANDDSSLSAGFAAVRPQGSGTSVLLAAVNAVAGRLSLPHTMSQSNYAGLPSISELPQDDLASTSALRQRDADIAVGMPSPGFMLNAVAPGFRRTTSNLRTGGSADLSSMAALSGQLSRKSSRGLQLPAYSVPGIFDIHRVAN